MTIDVMKKSKIFIGVALALVLLSWISIFVFGLEPGINLKGGTQWRTKFEKDVQINQIEGFFKSEYGIQASAQKVSGEEIMIRLPNITESQHQKFSKALKNKFGSFKERSFSSVGPTIGRELRNKSIWAGLGVLVGIFLFVAWSFRKGTQSISSWKYGSTALLALAHDLSLPLGVFSVLGYIQGIKVDTTFIVAILVVLGFSVNDTIVVFDRIRENMKLDRGKSPVKEIINKSVNETFMRSINTSLTLIAVLVSLLLFGPYSLFYFILTILVGTIAGTYSSIFVASPILYRWSS
ncbi:MAG: protein translocase subunit SecF [Candidatus Magasanikbacteria bacterium]